MPVYFKLDGFVLSHFFRQNHIKARAFIGKLIFIDRNKAVVYVSPFTAFIPVMHGIIICGRRICSVRHPEMFFSLGTF